MQSKKQIKILLARQLRKKQTGAEYVMWEALRSRKIGAKFRRQHPIKGFIVDFYCPERRLAIEVDGRIHKKQVAYDKMRENIIKSVGVNILRFSNTEAVFKTAKVINSIKKYLDSFPSQ